jgi:hypothetical protein
MGKKLAEDSIQGINNVDDQDWTNYTPDMLRIAYRIFDKEKPVPGPEKKKWSQVAEAKLRFIKLQTEAVEAELQWKKEEQEAKMKCMLEMHVILSPGTRLKFGWNRRGKFGIDLFGGVEGVEMNCLIFASGSENLRSIFDDYYNPH